MLWKRVSRNHNHRRSPFLDGEPLVRSCWLFGNLLRSRLSVSALAICIKSAPALEHIGRFYQARLIPVRPDLRIHARNLGWSRSVPLDNRQENRSFSCRLSREECRLQLRDLLPGNARSSHFARHSPLEPRHGWGITQRIQQVSMDVFQIGQGSLYPAPVSPRIQGLDQSRMGQF